MLRKRLPTICTVCARDCKSPESLAAHLRGRPHAQRVEEFSQRGQPIDTKPAVAIRARIDASTGCELCQIPLPPSRREAHERSENHRRRLRFGQYLQARNQSEADKNGISILPKEIDFGIVDTSSDMKGDDDGVYYQNIVIRNTSGHSIVLQSITDMRSKHKAYVSPYNGPKVPDQPIMADGQCKCNMAFELPSRTASGIYQTSLRFQFFNRTTGISFVIIRQVKTTVGNKADLEALKPISPNIPKPQPTPESFVPKKEIVRGEKPPAMSKIDWKVPLQQYPIPAWLSQKIQENVDGSTKDRIDALKKSIPAGWDGLSYRDKFQRVLWIEEAQLARDVRQYDMEDVTMERQGPYFQLFVPGLAENRPSVIVGDAIHVRSSGRWWGGYVHEVRQSDVRLKFDARFNPLKGTNFEVHFTVSRLPHRRMHQALSQNLKFSLIYPFENEANKAVEPNADALKLTWYNRNVGTNPPQQKAVAGILTKTTGMPLIIYGPPGTGKTSVAVEAIRQVLKKDSRTRILVSCPSNMACDLVTQRLDLNRSELFRLNAPSRTVKDVLLPRVLDNALVNDEGTFAVHSVDKLKTFRVIVSTCISAAVLGGVGIKPGHFTHIMIDEAGQSLETESMIPLQYAASGTHEILFGDPNQLGPIVRSPLAAAFGLNKSYLSRLMALAAYDKNFRNKTFFKLTQNYRSHPAILDFPSKEFYNGELVPCADAAITHSLLRWDKFKNPRFPILFHSIIGQDEREARSPSFFNAAEAIQVKAYIEELCSEMKMRGEEIGIISPYNAQVGKIRQLLQRSKPLAKVYSAIKTGSVEIFQGQERRAIILSTVRSSASMIETDLKHAIGFLSNPRRFNVATTRAQACLIVIGNPDILGTDKLWRRFLSYIHQNGSWIGPNPTVWSPKAADEDIPFDQKLEEMIADLGVVKLEMEDDADPEDREWVRLEQ